MTLPAVAAHADTTSPTVVNDNAVTCADINLASDSQMGANGTGNASADGLVGIVTGGTTLGLTGPANVVVDGVVIKGGDAYNLYTSPTLPFSGTAPLVGKGNLPQLSHWFACYRLVTPQTGGTTGGTTDPGTTGSTTGGTTGGTTDPGTTGSTTGGTTDPGTTGSTTGGTTGGTTDPGTTGGTTGQQSTPAIVVPPATTPASTTPTVSTPPATAPSTATVAAPATAGATTSSGSTTTAIQPKTTVSKVTAHHTHRSTGSHVLGARAVRRSVHTAARPSTTRRVVRAEVLATSDVRTEPTAGQLPFTGVNVLPMVDGGVGAIILGALTLRIGRRRPRGRHAG